MQPPIPESGSETLAPSNVLQGKTALVTGAARRVGATIARVLHGAGANVVLHYRSSVEDAAQLARELNEARPGSAQVAECDLLQVSQLEFCQPTKQLVDMPHTIAVQFLVTQSAATEQA